MNALKTLLSLECIVKWVCLCVCVSFQLYIRTIGRVNDGWWVLRIIFFLSCRWPVRSPYLVWHLMRLNRHWIYELREHNTQSIAYTSVIKLRKMIFSLSTRMYSVCACSSMRQTHYTHIKRTNWENNKMHGLKSHHRSWSYCVNNG